MAKQTINIGAVENDGTGDTARDGGQKINDNFDELYLSDAENIRRNGTVDFEATQNTRTLLPVTTGTYDLGSASFTWNDIHVSVTSGGTVRASHRGSRAYGTNADVFWGMDNVYEGFYSQRTTVVNSTATDNSEDHTNLYQGDSTFPVTEINYFTGDGSIADIGQEPQAMSGAVTVGRYDSATTSGGGGLQIYGRASSRFSYLFYDTTTPERFVICGSDSNKSVTETNSIGLGGAKVTAIEPVASTSANVVADNDNAIDLGKTGNQWKNLYLGESVFIAEKASALADIAGKGQLWVKNTTPNELWFTDDAGTDTQLGVAPTPTVADFIHIQSVTIQALTSVTTVNLTWDDTALHKDTATFTHSTSTNASRIEVEETGRYSITAKVSALNRAANSRFTLKASIAKNGTVQARTYNSMYSRGANYQDLDTTTINTEIELVANDYIEVAINRKTGTADTIPAQCEIIMRRID